MTLRKKLIEVALPLEAINRESAREKSIRHGHPSTLHLWWARRPLAACRAVLFAQLVDDPSAHPEEFPTEADEEVERKRLFDLIERLVVWENANDETLLAEAHAEILKSTDGSPPPILDPFAGGGSIPLEAQRLGLPVYASDLNPVPVLINRALVEVPSRWAGQPPVFPGSASARIGAWPGASGLTEDVNQYGRLLREEAHRRIGDLYPPVVTEQGAVDVIAWIWARDVPCANPACGVRMPLVNSFTLSRRRGREAHVLPVVKGREITFAVEHTKQPSTSGTVGRNGATCLVCGSSMPLRAIREEGRKGNLGSTLLCVVAEGDRRRLYLPPEKAASVLVEAPDIDYLATPLPEKALGFRVQAYGLTTHRDLYTARQQLLLTTLAALIPEVVQTVRDDGGSDEYARDVGTYLALLLGRVANRNSSQSFWNPNGEKVEQVFARNAMPMIWVSAEANPFSDSTGNILGQLRYLTASLAALPARGDAQVDQRDARHMPDGRFVVSTDPPYYDNVPYADLSDFFYVWHRASLQDVLPSLYSTVTVPKAAELIAEPARTGSPEAAAEYFESGLREVFRGIVNSQDPQYPFTIYYAFKQAESDASGTASTGWETMLQGLLDAGAMIVATWPVRTELAGGLREVGRNALASSVVLACRRRPGTAEAVNRRQFIGALKADLPLALRNMQQGSVAPVDLAQATIGPGMAVFSRYSRVVEADGSDMTVRTALALINQVLDEVLVEQEGDFDADTRFCVKWFSQFGWDEAPSGEADVLARATNTAVNGLVRGGVFRAVAGKARLLAPEELSADWDPLTDERVSVWEVVVRLAHALTEVGVDSVAPLFAAAGQRVDLDTAQELAYLLFALCEKKGWTESARLFNALGSSWSYVTTASRSLPQEQGTQSAFNFDDEGSEA